MATPNIDAAIRAYLEQCSDRSFSSVNIEWARPIVVATLRAAIPKDPPAEVIEATASAAFEAKMHFYAPLEKWDWQREEIKATWRAAAIAAHKAQPIYHELWSS